MVNLPFQLGHLHRGMQKFVGMGYGTNCVSETSHFSFLDLFLDWDIYVPLFVQSQAQRRALGLQRYEILYH